MGLRGPTPTPTNILKLRGSPRASRNKNEPQPDQRLPICPTWLSGDAKAAWKQVIHKLDEMGCVANVDRNALVRYCDMWAKWKAMSKWIDNHDIAYPLKNEDGTIKYMQQWPQVAVYHKLCQSLLRMEQEFGMTPAARSRIELPEEKGKSDEGKARFFSAG